MRPLLPRVQVVSLEDSSQKDLIEVLETSKEWAETTGLKKICLS